uniref:NAD(P)(+)--arginine ADP-ribosyltransferase n=1 Tax=Neogobius melanostomus TaxID=47308 RepID=A0A8C6U316_9GOBI
LKYTITNTLYMTKKMPLDMAPDAVDDMYEGCAKDALNKFVFSNLLKEELNNSEAFQRAWDQSQTPACTKIIPGGMKEHTTALRTYVTSDETFRKNLNNAVYTCGTNTTTYEDNFYFKSLHFLLMDSIQLLNPGACKTVYAFSDPIFTVQNGTRVRFGRFYMAYSDLDILKKERDMYGEVILGINTCFFAELEGNICHDDPIRLLSPTEEFTVEEVKTVEEDGASYNMIMLKHSQLKGMHNCYMFSR